MREQSLMKVSVMLVTPPAVSPCDSTDSLPQGCSLVSGRKDRYWRCREVPPLCSIMRMIMAPRPGQSRASLSSAHRASLSSASSLQLAVAHTGVRAAALLTSRTARMRCESGTLASRVRASASSVSAPSSP
eukprot:scaffold6145_cov60-Phaeocystis_antarctica.AAC.1